jgi:hypothetical protein
LGRDVAEWDTVKIQPLTLESGELYGPQTENPDPKRGQNGIDFQRPKRTALGCLAPERMLLRHKLLFTRGF